MTFKEYLLEAVYGNMATVFHRTKKPTEMISQGYKYGGGSMYGDGLYCCFDIHSQFNHSMDHYGDYIIKIAVNLDNFLILDKDMQHRIFGKFVSLEDQIKSKHKLKTRKLSPSEKNELLQWAKINAPEELNTVAAAITAEELFDNDLPKTKDYIYEKHKDFLDSLQFSFSLWDLKQIKKYDKLIDQGTMTSNVALHLPDYLRYGFDGMLFTGSNDGRVCVIYTFWHCAKIISYAHAPIDSNIYNVFNYVEKLKWIPIKQKVKIYKGEL